MAASVILQDTKARGEQAGDTVPETEICGNTMGQHDPGAAAGVFDPGVDSRAIDGNPHWLSPSVPAPGPPDLLRPLQVRAILDVCARLSACCAADKIRNRKFIFEQSSRTAVALGALAPIAWLSRSREEISGGGRAAIPGG
jgi:hypothetical protein